VEGPAEGRDVALIDTEIGAAPREPLSGHREQTALRLLLHGEGLAMVVQPIIDLRTMSVHA